MTEIHLLIVLAIVIIVGTLTYYIGLSRVNLIREERYLALEIENAMLSDKLMRCLRR